MQEGAGPGVFKGRSVRVVGRLVRWESKSGHRQAAPQLQALAVTAAGRVRHSKARATPSG